MKKTKPGSMPATQTNGIVKLFHAIEIIYSLAEKALEQTDEGLAGAHHHVEHFLYNDPELLVEKRIER